MTNLKVVLLLLLIAGTTGCKSPYIQSTWKNGDRAALTGNKVLVAVILADNDTMLRKHFEEQACTELKTLGYDAVSSWQEFGQHGLATLDQEQTYLRLCEHGIDAVMTLALLDKNSRTPAAKIRGQDYSSLSFYNRIWSYRQFNRQPPVNGSTPDNLFFEVFLFDLKLLQPVYLIRTTGIASGSLAHVYGEYINRIITHLYKKKVIGGKAKPRAA